MVNLRNEGKTGVNNRKKYANFPQLQNEGSITI
jgi:hypothetical protein